MTDSFTANASVAWDILRSVFSLLDRPAYAILQIVYQLFFNVASADLFSNDTIMKFYGRVQVILGVFMMFQLAMTILRGIIEPDNFTKDKGVGSLLRRVIVSLILITLLMPISIPSPRNEYERQINNNGLLFGTLYSLQHRILSNNTLGRLILGTTNTSSTYISSDSSEEENLKESSRIFTSTILKAFYRINLVPEDKRESTGDKDPATLNENRICKDIDDDILAAYTKLDADPGEIISMVNETCTVNESGSLFGSKKYVFNYMPLVSMIVPVIFIFILLSFTVDVAVRAVKLAVLRLIAPIPLISYMNPTGGGDEAFKSWTKTLTSTYLDLFIRLAVVYFVIFLIQDMIVNGIVISNSTGAIGFFSQILIWIGLFIFAKQAPKFIKDVLGLKNDPGKLFGGFGEIGAAVGMAAAVPGAIGSGIASARASRMADETRRQYGENVNPNGVFNRGKHLLAGIGGTFAGGATGMKAAATAKDHGFKASMEAMRKRNADALDRGNNGSTLFGRIGSTASNIFTGEGSAAATERDIASWESRQKALDAIKSRVSGEMVKKDWTFGAARNGHVDHSGSSLDGVQFNYKNFTAQMEQAKAAGSSTITVRDSSGTTRTIDYATAELMKGQILQSNENDYVSKAQLADFTAADGTTYSVATGNGQQDLELVSLVEDAMAKGGSGWNGTDFNRNRNNPINSRDDYSKSSEGIGMDIREAKRANTINKANDMYSGGKK